jgi:hypothetical protein
MRSSLSVHLNSLVHCCAKLRDVLAVAITVLCVGTSTVEAEWSFTSPQQAVGRILFGLHTYNFEDKMEKQFVSIYFLQDNPEGSRFVMRSTADGVLSEVLTFYIFQKMSCVYEVRAILSVGSGKKLEREVYFPGFIFDFAKYRSIDRRSGFLELIGAEGMCSGEIIYNVFGGCAGKGSAFRTSMNTPKKLESLMPAFLNRYCRSEYTMNSRLESLS